MCLLFKPPYLALPRLPPRHHATWARSVRTWQRLSCAHRANQLHIAPPAHLRPPPAAASPFRAAWPTLGLSWLAGARPRALRGREWQAGQHVHMVCSAWACTGAWVALQANELRWGWTVSGAAGTCSPSPATCGIRYLLPTPQRSCYFPPTEVLLFPSTCIHSSTHLADTRGHTSRAAGCRGQCPAGTASSGTRCAGRSAFGG